MKTLPIIIAATLAATTSYATLIPLSVFREVSISGVAVNETYAFSDSSSAFGSLNQLLSSNVTDSDSEGTIYTAWSRASQISSISSDMISVITDVLAETTTQWTFPATIAGPVFSAASTAFSLTFALDQPSSLALLSTGTSIDVRPGVPLFSVELSSDGEDIFSTDSFLFDRLISVPAGTYTLELDSSAAAVIDPLGYIEGISGTLTMRATSVPETGSTLLYLLGGFLVLATPRLVWATKERMKPQKGPSTCIREDMGYGGDWE